MSINWCDTCKRFHVGPCRLTGRPMVQPPLLDFTADQQHKHVHETQLLDGCRTCKSGVNEICPDCYRCRLCTRHGGGCAECRPTRFLPAKGGL